MERNPSHPFSSFVTPSGEGLFAYNAPAPASQPNYNCQDAYKLDSYLQQKSLGDQKISEQAGATRYGSLGSSGVFILQRWIDVLHACVFSLASYADPGISSKANRIRNAASAFEALTLLHGKGLPCGISA